MCTALPHPSIVNNALFQPYGGKIFFNSCNQTIFGCISIIPFHVTSFTALNSNWFCDCCGEFYSRYLTVDEVPEAKVSATSILYPFLVFSSTCPKPELFYHVSLTFVSAFHSVLRKCGALRSTYSIYLI